MTAVLRICRMTLAEGFYLHAEGFGCCLCFIVVAGIAAAFYAMGKRRNG